MPYVKCSICDVEIWRKLNRLRKYQTQKCTNCNDGFSKELDFQSENEIWKDVEGFEEHLEVSNLGKIRSKDRYRGDGNFIKGKKCAQKVKKNGYLEISIRVKPIRKFLLVHRVVAKAFIPRIEGLDYINHKNGNKKDNRVENLEWCTQKYNSLHAHKSGLCSIEENHYKAKLTKEKVLEIRKSNESNSVLASKYGVSSNTVKYVRDRKSWKYFDLDES